MSLPIAVLDQIAPGGRIRLAANMANASIIREEAPGKFFGPVAALADRLASLLAVEVAIIPFASGGAILAAPEEWDAAVLAVDPSRQQICYVCEVAQVAATLAGPRKEFISTCGDADRHGVRIATARGAAYESHLLRSLKAAEIVPFDTPAEARDAMLRGDCQFVAGIRTTLEKAISQHSGIRLMDDDFLVVSQALALQAEQHECGAALAKKLQEAGFC